MSNIRAGKYGVYFGSYFEESEPLTAAEMFVNAGYICDALTSSGWTLEAIAGLLGNLEHESSINPGRWQSDEVGNLDAGYSLVQWTPSRNYLLWCVDEGKNDPSEMDTALDRILYELENNIQYYATPDYPLTFREFTQSKGSAYDLACAFAWNYERSHTVLYGTEEEKEALRQKRGGSALIWHAYLEGRDPPDPGGKTKKRRKKYNFVLFGKKPWRNTV